MTVANDEQKITLSMYFISVKSNFPKNTQLVRSKVKYNGLEQQEFELCGSTDTLGFFNKHTVCPPYLSLASTDLTNPRCKTGLSIHCGESMVATMHLFYALLYKGLAHLCIWDPQGSCNQSPQTYGGSL